MPLESEGQSLPHCVREPTRRPSSEGGKAPLAFHQSTLISIETRGAGLCHPSRCLPSGHSLGEQRLLCVAILGLVLRRLRTRVRTEKSAFAAQLGALAVRLAFAGWQDHADG